MKDVVRLRSSTSPYSFCWRVFPEATSQLAPGRVAYIFGGHALPFNLLLRMDTLGTVRVGTFCTCVHSVCYVMSVVWPLLLGLAASKNDMHQGLVLALLVLWWWRLYPYTRPEHLVAMIGLLVEPNGQLLRCPLFHSVLVSTVR